MHIVFDKAPLSHSVPAAAPLCTLHTLCSYTHAACPPSRGAATVATGVNISRYYSKLSNSVLSDQSRGGRALPLRTVDGTRLTSRRACTTVCSNIEKIFWMPNVTERSSSTDLSSQKCHMRCPVNDRFRHSCTYACMNNYIISSAICERC